MEGNIIFNKQSYTFTEFATISLPKDLNWATNTQLFVKDWLNNKQSFLLQTSGSTGKPKNISIQREQMLSSANATIQYLDIQTGSSALLCMNPDMIGGRMMLVRALVGAWDLYILPPSSNPMIDASIAFTAMVPLQVESLMESPEGIDFLNRIDQLIIGGANISDSLSSKLQTIKAKAYQTFGMTETVSHIALKKLNGEGKTDEYRLIGDNKIAVDAEGKLSIKGTVTGGEWIQTNDLVRQTPNGFEWLGRSDLAVNSGGIKIQIEELEKELCTFFQKKIWVWKEADKKLGEKVIGMTDDPKLISQIQSDYNSLKSNFKKYHLPKEWVLVKQWLLTSSGKPDRNNTLVQNK